MESIANGTIISECKADDCISKIEVIDYLCKHCPDDGECFKDCDEIKHLRNMPTVTPQTRKGHWIDTNDDGFLYHRIYKCSKCGATVCDYPENIKKYKYCSNCDAKMVEPQESEG